MSSVRALPLEALEELRVASTAGQFQDEERRAGPRADAARQRQTLLFRRSELAHWRELLRAESQERPKGVRAVLEAAYEPDIQEDHPGLRQLLGPQDPSCP